MDVLIALLLVFVGLPLALLMWMPGWKSLGVMAVLLLGVMAWFWFEVATTSKNYQQGAAFANWLAGAYSIAVIAGITIKAATLSHRDRGR